MRGVALERRKVIAAGVGAGLAVLPVGWVLRRAAGGTEEDWRTDAAPLEQAFPLLGPLTDARWVSSRDDDRSLPSPELAISGFARLAPGRLSGLTAAHAFVPGEPVDDFSSWFEKPLRGAGPKDPQWVRSPELDRADGGRSTRLWFDRRSDTVRFRALNPYG
ncbi:hypothetical protein SLAV_04775 [Streptomyces lavendulae subsp. lavendulae]|uniref:Uncharacterized protein n=1 Tax=Streptomyces lavendulae subsp. lavendulae TaxID=58340 RepID=A0A2K8P7Y7_STRLA|nr:hypothetical protein SLAV_04775 [Streptomyces lavendulae subsp. lavendulae]QUQ52703.1 hypothetical protein SLLC_02815 [Streptomyces lavendulae subsp. lavendulae]